MENFRNFIKAASQLKSSKMSVDKKKFDALPEYRKLTMYCSSMFVNLRKQSFKLKKIAYDNLKTTALEELKDERFVEAHYRFCRVISLLIFVCFFFCSHLLSSRALFLLIQSGILKV